MNRPGVCWFALLLLLLLVAACQVTSAEPQTNFMAPAAAQPVETRIEPSAVPQTAVPTNTPVLDTPLPTSTLRATPTNTREPSPTFLPDTPTSTPVPTLVPTPVPTPCGVPGRIERGLFSTALAGELSYRVYLPPCYGVDGHVYPTVYLLGGNIHDDSIWDHLGADELAETGIMTGELAPFIIVMPDGGWVANQTSGGPQSFETLILNDLVPAMERSYCIWPDAAGRAIGGLSRGGYWALEIAFRRPELFRSVGAHSFALVDTHAGPDVDPVWTGAANDLGGLRIRLDLGERDPYLVQAQPLHDALIEAGVGHVWQINPGQHDEAYWMEQLPAYLAWYNEGWEADRADLPRCSGSG